MFDGVSIKQPTTSMVDGISIKEPTLLAQAVPMTAPGVVPYKEILAGLGIAAKSKEGAAIAKFITQHAKDIQVISATPQGRAMLAVAVMGGIAGYHVGKNLDTDKLKSTAAGLRLIFGSNDSIDNKAKAIANLITNINSPLPKSAPYNKDVVPGQNQSLRQSIEDAKFALTETKRLPRDDTNNAIIKAQTERLEALENKLRLQQQTPVAAPVVNKEISVPTPNVPLKPVFDINAAQQRTEKDRVKALQAEAGTQKAAFLVSLQDQKGRDSVANKETLVGWINSESPDQLKGRLLDITNIIKNPSGMGNVYGSYEFANGSKPRQATDPNFTQVQYGGGLYKISDLKYLATNLDNYLKKIDAAAPQQVPERPAPATSTTALPPDGGTGLGQQNPALGIPLSPTDLRMLSEARDATAVLLKEYTNAAPGSDAARDKQKLEELLSSIDTAMQAKRLPSGAQAKQMLGDLLHGIRQFYTTSNSSGNQNGGPSGPNGPDWKKILGTVVIGVGGAALLSRFAAQDDIARHVEKSPDFRFKEFDLQSRLQNRPDLLNPPIMAQLRSDIIEHYLNQAKQKIDSQEAKTGSANDTFAYQQKVADTFLAVRALANPSVADANFNPIAAFTSSSVAIRSLGDSREAQYITQALALANLDIAQVNTVVSETWSSQTSQSPMFDYPDPNKGFSQALDRQNLTEADFTRVKNSSDPRSIEEMAVKTQVAIDTLVSRGKELEADIRAIRNFYQGPRGALGFNAGVDDLIDYAKKGMEGGNGSNKKLIEDTVELTRKQIGFNPTFVNSLINAKEQERTTVVKDIVQLQNGLTSLKIAQESLAATRTRDEVARQISGRIKPLEVELGSLKDKLTALQAEQAPMPRILDGRRSALAELKENIDKFEGARAKAEAIAQRPFSILGQNASLTGEVETLNERLVISKADSVFLVSELRRIEKLYPGAISEQQYTYTKASIERFVKDDGNEGVRVPLVAYPYISATGTTKVSGALTEEEYAAAIESRRNLSVIISKQEAEAVKVQEKIRDIQKQMETVSGSILKEQQNLDRVYLNVDRGSTPRVPIVPPLQVPGQQ